MLPIKIPTYDHIAEFLNAQYPDGIVKGRNDLIGTVLINLMLTRAPRASRPTLKEDHDNFVILQINLGGQRHSVSRRYLTQSQIASFNNYVSLLIRQKSRDYIATYLLFDKSLTRAVDYTMDKLGICETLIYKDALIKDFQRFRGKNDDLRIYRAKDFKNSSAILSDSHLTPCTAN